MRGGEAKAKAPKLTQAWDVRGTSQGGADSKTRTQAARQEQSAEDPPLLCTGGDSRAAVTNLSDSTAEVYPSYAPQRYLRS